MVILLNPDEITFKRMENGFLRLEKKDGETFETVECAPLFPLSRPDRYISVTSRSNGEVTELGILKNLKSLKKQQQALVREEIEFRYFSPEITDIKKITSQYGVDQWDVVTDKGDKTFLVRDIKENIIIRETGFITITDIDKCRFRITNYRKLSPKSRMELEQTLL